MPKASSTITKNSSMIAAVITTIGASLRCIGPLALLAPGIGVTLIFLALAFRKLYLVSQQCAPGNAT